MNSQCLVIGGRANTCYVEIVANPDEWIARKAAVPPPPPFHAAILDGAYDPETILNWAQGCLHDQEVVPGIYLSSTFDALGRLRLEGNQRWRHVHA